MPPVRAEFPAERGADHGAIVFGDEAGAGVVHEAPVIGAVRPAHRNREAMRGGDVIGSEAAIGQ
ncbi:hypothetical protein OKW40_000888 [Paraburkholderia sp. RAU6.4a]